jgi:hypothetical protein
MACDREKLLARHKRYNSSDKGLARYRKYAKSPHGSNARYWRQKSRRLSQRLAELHGIPEFVRENHFRYRRGCQHCWARPRSGHLHCRWCAESFRQYQEGRAMRGLKSLVL